MANPNQNTQFPSHSSSSSSSSSLFGTHLFSQNSLRYIETFLRPLVREEVERIVESHYRLPPHLSSSSQVNEEETTIVVGSRTSSSLVKHKLCFVNKIPSTIFTSNEIEAENGERLQIALHDTTDNEIVWTTNNPLSSALVELVVLDGEFGSGTELGEDFNKNVITQRVQGERPLLVGNDKKIRLRNGVAFIESLSFTQNSCRTRTKNFRLGVRIVDDDILNKFHKIGEAVSNPFRVKDQRGQGNKKNHPPKGSDEVYRLEGIGKDGQYHTRLSFNGIKTVHDFVKAHQLNPHSLRKFLGKRISDKKWKAIVKHAMEYVPPPMVIIPTTYDYSSSGKNLVENNDEGIIINLEANNKQNTDGFSETTTMLDQVQEYFDVLFNDSSSPLLLHGEASTSSNHNAYTVEDRSTFNQYNFQGV